MNHLHWLIWWAQCSPTQLSKISKSLYIVDELSNHNDLTINLTFKIPSEEVWSTLIYFISQTIRSVLKTWLTKSHFWCPLLAMDHGPTRKEWVKVTPYWNQRGGLLSVELGFYPANPTNSGVLPMSEYMWIFFVVPTISLCKMYLANYYDAFVTLMYI